MTSIQHYYQLIQNKIDWFFRRITAKQRALPNCLIIGAQKAGTSSLYYYLTQHAQVNASFCKEVHYFDGGNNPKIDTYMKGENWYRANFPLKKNLKVNDQCIDATPMYLFNPLAPARIKALVPNAKLIILLRNPVERAISHYFHVKRHGFESLNIKDALEKEGARLNNVKKEQNYKHPNFRLYSYQERGLYLAQIKRYQALFDDNQLLILNCDDLFEKPEATLQQVFNFLAIDNKVKIDSLKSQNVGDNKEKIPLETYQQLQDYFEQANMDLFKHIKKDYHW